MTSPDVPVKITPLALAATLTGLIALVLLATHTGDEA